MKQKTESALKLLLAARHFKRESCVGWNIDQEMKWKFSFAARAWQRESDTAESRADYEILLFSFAAQACQQESAISTDISTTV